MPMKTVKIPNISCGHCVMTIKNEVGELDHVINVQASAETKTVTIEWSEPQSWETIHALLSEINFPPEE